MTAKPPRRRPSRPASTKPAGDAPPRIVIDTNVVVSALLFTGGPPARLRIAWQRRDCVPLVSADTVRELVRVLAYPKFALDAEEREELLADYLPCADPIELPDPLPIVPACRDPHDLVFLHLATAGDASALITGDKGLLALAAQTPYPILTCEAWLAAHPAGRKP